MSEILVITLIIWRTRDPAFLPVLLLLQPLSRVAVFPSSNYYLMLYWIWHLLYLLLLPKGLAGAFASSAAAQEEGTAAFQTALQRVPSYSHNGTNWLLLSYEKVLLIPFLILPDVLVEVVTVGRFLGQSFSFLYSKLVWGFYL